MTVYWHSIRLSNNILDVNFIFEQSPSPQSVSKLSMESAEKLNREMEKRTALQNAMIGALSTNLGFSNGRPMAACIIFKSLMYWRALENDSATALLDQIYRALVSQVEMDKKNNSQLTYWLSNVSSLLSLIQQTVRRKLCPVKILKDRFP